MTITLTGLLGDIADAIRGKDGTTAEIAAADFPDRIAAIPAGPDPEPSSGQMYALVYPDGFVSVQYGDEPYDESAHGTVEAAPTFDPPAAGTTPTSSYWPWYPYISKVTGLRFRHACALGSAANMFVCFTNLSYVDMSKVDMSSCTSTYWMFYQCAHLGVLYGSGSWDLSSVTDASQMFFGCNVLYSLDSSGWGMGSCTDLSSAFYECKALSSLDVSSWDVSKVTTIKYAFYKCTALATIDVSGWDCRSLADMSNAFENCSAVTDLDLSGWGAPLTQVSSAFYGCSALLNLDLSGIDTSACTSMNALFDGCSSLRHLDLSSLDTSACTDLANMFNTCKSLAILDLGSLDTSKATFVYSMFYGCTSLQRILVGDGWSMASVSSGNSMFYNCSKLVGGNGTTFSSSKAGYAYAVVDTADTPGYLTARPSDSAMAYGLLYADGHLSLQLGNSADTETHGDLVAAYTGWNMVSFTYSTIIWYGRLSEIKTVVATSAVGVKSLSNLFYMANSLVSADMHQLDVSAVTSASLMFNSCTSLTTCDLHGWDVSAMKDLSNAFNNCPLLDSVDMSGWASASPTYISGLFRGCTSLRELDLRWLDDSACSTITMSDFSNLALTRLLAGASVSWKLGGTAHSLRPGSASGRWYAEDGTAYEPSSLPSNVAATYTSTDPTAA